MHPCLLVSEIIELIIKFSDSNNPPHSSPAALAQTCRAFYEPACDIRWKSLNSLQPLLRCFSGDICAPDREGYYVSYDVRPTKRFAITNSVLFNAPAFHQVA